MFASTFYNIVVEPLLESAFRIGALWNEKARKAVKGRVDWEKKLASQLEKSATQKVLLFHAPSVGEFLQGRAVIERLINRHPDVGVVATHFSPSAENIVSSYKRAIAHSYLPFDSPKNMRMLFEITKPAIVILSRADVWHNLVLEANSRDIPVALIAGSIPNDSLFNRWFLKVSAKRFRLLTCVGAVSEEEASNFRELGLPESAVEVTGDPRFDQTWERARGLQPDDSALKAFPREGWIFVAGSTWDKDENVLLNAFKQVSRKRQDARLILVPHEPTPSRLASIKGKIKSLGMQCVSLSELEEGTKVNTPIVVVDKVGILGKIYSLGKCAFVGGSFVRKVHNVMEPACFGMPVIVGPRHKNSREAVMMIKEGGCFQVKDDKEFAKLWLQFMEDEIFRKQAGSNAVKFIESQTGSAERTARWLEERFPKIFSPVGDR